ncbi:MAG: SAM-dependent methyltransferase, partial [Armatimonadota bacterium]
EIVRVLKPHGWVWWFDFMYNNPRNPDVKGIKPREIRRLFPHTKFWCRTCVLARPLARRLAPLSLELCQLLEWIPPLRTHCVAIIQVAK